MSRYRKPLLVVVLAVTLPVLSLTSASAMSNGLSQQDAPPWIALIMINNKTHCTGALVGNGWILTAAHCVTSSQTGDLIDHSLVGVALGRSHVKNTDEGKTYKVDSTKDAPGIIQMPGYTFDASGFDNTNDAALIRLKDFDEDRWHALPIAFEDSVVYGKDGVTLYGYGNTSPGKGAGQLWKSPNGAYRQVSNNSQCKDQFVCFEATSNTKAQHGDSGAPWLRWTAGAWQIVGVLDGTPSIGKDDPIIAAAMLAKVKDGETSLVQWVRDTAHLPRPSTNTIVRNPKSSNSWLFGSDGYRRWIPTGGDFLCFQTQGSLVENLPQVSIDTIPDRVSTHAKCTPNSGPVTPPQLPGTGPSTPTIKSPTPSPTPPPSNRPTPIRSFGKIDFNHDGYSDFVIYAGGTWAVKSGRGPHEYIAQGVALGKSTDIPFVGDFNGDSTPDFAIYSGGQWAVRSGNAPYSYVAQGIQLGGPSSTPVIGDFNHDSVADFGIYSGGQWAVKSGKSPYAYVAQGIQLGGTNSVPVVGDFNGDSYSDFGIYENGTWAVRSGEAPYNYVSQGIALGGSGSKPLVGDVNGDGKSDYVIYSGGQWAVKSGAAPYAYIAQGVLLGGASSSPQLGDFNADGRVDYTIWDGGVWAAKSSIDPNPYSAQGVQLGSPGEVALTG